MSFLLYIFLVADTTDCNLLPSPTSDVVICPKESYVNPALALALEGFSVITNQGPTQMAVAKYDTRGGWKRNNYIMHICFKHTFIVVMLHPH